MPVCLKKLINLLTIFCFFDANISSAWAGRLGSRADMDYEIKLRFIKSSSTSQTSHKFESSTLSNVPTVRLKIYSREHSTKLDLDLTSTPLNLPSWLSFNQTSQQTWQGTIGSFEFALNNTGTLTFEKGNPLKFQSLYLDTNQNVQFKNAVFSKLDVKAHGINLEESLKITQAVFDSTHDSSQLFNYWITPNTSCQIDALHLRQGYFLNQGSLFSSSPLKLNIEQGQLKNEGVIESTRSLFLQGSGEFLNLKILKAPNIFLTVDILINEGLINGKSLENLGSSFTNSGNVQIACDSSVETMSLNNTKGKFHSGGHLKIRTSTLKNHQGSLSGAQGTDVQTKKFFDNKNGELGAQKKTILHLQQKTFVDYLGRIKGDEVHINHKKILRARNGILDGQRLVSLTGKTVILPDVKLQTPFCTISADDFHLDDQTECVETVVVRKRDQNFELTHPYRTKGILTLCQDGVTYDSIIQNMDQRFGSNQANWPQYQHVFSLQATIQADRGLGVYAPAAKLLIGSEQYQRSPEILLQEDALCAYVSDFKLEKGAIAANSSMIRAPHGIQIGQLIRDPLRDCFITLYCHGTSSFACNLGDCTKVTDYRFFEQSMLNVYDGHHLMVLPVAISNNSCFLIRTLSAFEGPLKNYGYFETNDCLLKTDQESECIASVFKIRNGFDIQGKGNLSLKPYVTQMAATLRAYNGYPHGLTYESLNGSYVNSDPTYLTVQGILSATHPITISNQASYLSFLDKSPQIVLQNKDVSTRLDQKFLSGSWDERRKLYQELSPEVASHGGLFGFMSERNNTIARPTNSFIRAGVSESWAISFLIKTNNFPGAQRNFPANTSAGNTLILPANNTLLEGNISAPNILVSAGAGGVTLGSSNPYCFDQQNPIRDLVSKGFSLHTTYISEDLKQIIDQYKKPQHQFIFRERFWFDSDKAQQFYKDIQDHVIIYNADRSLEKTSVNMIFSLSPHYLVERVREECLNVLKRGYVYDGRSIDEDFVQELHRNTSLFLAENNLDKNALERALTVVDARLPAPVKPMIYYESFKDEKGYDVLHPRLYLPPHLMNQVDGKNGNKIRTKNLLIVPENLTPLQILNTFSNQPALQETVASAFAQNPHAVGFLEKRAILAQIQDKSPQQKVNFLTTTLTPPLIAAGPVILQGKIEAEKVTAIGKGTVASHGHIEATDILLASLFENVFVQSQVARGINQGHDVLADVIPYQSRLAAQGLVTLFAGQNVVLEGAQTSSKMGTHVQALADIYDIPVMLMTQCFKQHRGKYKGFETATTVRPEVSSHSSEQTIIFRAGDKADLHGTRFNATKGKIEAFNNIAVHDVHHTRQHELDVKKKGGIFRSSRTLREQSATQTSQGAQFNFEESLEVASERGRVTLTAPTIKAPTTKITAPQGQIHFNQGVNKHQAIRSESGSSAFWQNAKQQQEKHQTYTPPHVTGNLHLEAPLVRVERVAHQALSYLQENLITNGQLVFENLRELHESRSKSQQGPSQALSALISLTIGIATHGWGNAFLGQYLNSTGVIMAKAGFVHTCTQATLQTLSNGGDIGKTFKDLTTGQNLKSLALSMAAAGLIHTLSAELGLPSQTTETNPLTRGVEMPTLMSLVDHLKVQALQTAVHAALNVTIGEQDPRQVLEQSVRGLVANTAGAYLAQQIGQSYYKGMMDAFTHKLVHSMTGAGMGALLSKNPGQGALSGALGAVMAETLAEMIGDDRATLIGRFEAGEDPAALQHELKRHADYARLGAALGALLTNQDVDIAIQTATNAVENNSISLLIRMAMAGVTYMATSEGLSFATIATAAYLISQTQGDQAAVQDLVNNGQVKQISAGYLYAGKFYTDAALVWMAFQAANASVFESIKTDAKKTETSKARSSKNNASATSSSAAPPPDGWEPEDHDEDKSDRNNDNCSSVKDRAAQFEGKNNPTFKNNNDIERFIQRDWHKEIGVPDGWKRMDAKKQEGVRFRSDVKDGFNEIRFGKGDPKFDMPGRQVDYVKIVRNGQYRDIYGKVVLDKSFESHIPLQGNEKIIENLIKQLWN